MTAPRNMAVNAHATATPTAVLFESPASWFTDSFAASLAVSAVELVLVGVVPSWELCLKLVVGVAKHSKLAQRLFVGPDSVAENSLSSEARR